jgi:prepilin-type processing-associated H-X9-DG protein
LRMECASNLRQIGLAAVMYEDSQDVVAPARLCPSTWREGNDLYCRSLPSPNTWTGPNEIWWGPYDNRLGTTPTRALPGYVPSGILLPFTDGNPRIFRCPVGIDTTNGSPTTGQTFQVSYATTPSDRAYRRVEGKRFYAWDHMDLPVCPASALESTLHWTTWPADSAIKASRHTPPRHAGVYNSLYGDGHVSTNRPR